jgi:hypothetical protein
MSRGKNYPESADRDIGSDLIIRQKVELMIEYGHVAIRQFPKMERHVLGAEMRATMWSLLRYVVVCNKRYYKKTTLQDLDAELDLLRSQVRLAKNLGYIDFRKYENWARLNDEIGRLIGGWIKFAATSAAERGAH